MDIKSETVENGSYVGKIANLYNRVLEKKAQKKENTLIAFVMKATAREQEQHVQISKLQRELHEAKETISLLQMENEVKESLLILKEAELHSLELEIKALLQRTTLENDWEPVDNITNENKSPVKSNKKFSANEVISTFNNIIASPSKMNKIGKIESDNVVSTSARVPEDQKKLTIRKRSIRRTNRDVSNIPMNIAYNLRKKSKATN